MSWLFLAQHYRLPTRLLDWTELPLAAAFFAVADEEHSQDTGCLYALNPGRMNEKTVGENAVLPAQSEAFPVFQRAFDGKVPETDRIVSVIATEVDPRMMVQRSCFTIHGANAPPLEQLENADEFLLQFEIPPAAKPGIRMGLEQLGVKRSVLFPDLENLAKETKCMTFA